MGNKLRAIIIMTVLFAALTASVVQKPQIAECTGCCKCAYCTCSYNGGCSCDIGGVCQPSGPCGCLCTCATPTQPVCCIGCSCKDDAFVIEDRCWDTSCSGNPQPTPTPGLIIQVRNWRGTPEPAPLCGISQWDNNPTDDRCPQLSDVSVALGNAGSYCNSNQCGAYVALSREHYISVQGDPALELFLTSAGKVFGGGYNKWEQGGRTITIIFAPPPPPLNLEYSCEGQATFTEYYCEGSTCSAPQNHHHVIFADHVGMFKAVGTVNRLGAYVYWDDYVNQNGNCVKQRRQIWASATSGTLIATGQFQTDVNNSVYHAGGVGSYSSSSPSFDIPMEVKTYIARTLMFVPWLNRFQDAVPVSANKQITLSVTVAADYFVNTSITQVFCYPPYSRTMSISLSCPPRPPSPPPTRGPFPRLPPRVPPLPIGEDTVRIDVLRIR